MLMITLIALLLAIPLSSYSAKNASSTLRVDGSKISATLFTRITAIALLYAAALSYSSASVTSLDAGLGLYSGLIHATTVTQSMEVFLLVAGALILIPSPHFSYNFTKDNSETYSPRFQNLNTANGNTPLFMTTIPEYPMIILFTTLGATFLLASADLVSLYLAIELQSFGVYILAAIYRDSESATAAGLKYFLLGALSSALILLGSGLIYGYTGLTNLDSIYELTSVPALSNGHSSFDTHFFVDYNQGVVLGLMIITVGLLFKVASAPFHYWAPDVYDGTPTLVTTWLTVMPKISLFIFMLELYRGTGLFGYDTFLSITNNSVDPSSVSGIISYASTTLLLVCAFLSLVIGTVVGLAQSRIKRLLAYSTISHVGFLLLALVISSEESVEAFLFYIIQYSLTNINAFFVLLAFGYLINKSNSSSALLTGDTYDVQFISELRGQFRANPVLGLSFAICLFSMAGVPPLVGFFAKYTVLYSAIHNGYIFLAIVAILSSVVSAVYYLRVIRVIHFEGLYTDNEKFDFHSTISINSLHSYVIATLTLFVMLFAANPNLLLNSTSIMALSLYST